jgi:hypothetical protein
LYNLIVSGADDAWEGKPYQLPRSRIFEYTDEAISARFKELTPDQLARLYELPTLFAYERGKKRPARLGIVTKVRIRQREVQIEYQFREGSPAITNEELDACKWALDIEDFEFYRTHWAIKDVDLLEMLREGGVDVGPEEQEPVQEEEVADLPRAVAIPVQPKVFRVPEDPIDAALVAVMGPFQPDFDAMFETVARAAADVGLKGLNARQVWDAEELIQDIFALIYRSRMVVCDFSGQNANVFYEAGIAHTLGKVVIPIAQAIEDLPFDLRHHRALIYCNDPAGLDELAEKIAPRMRKIADSPL